MRCPVCGAESLGAGKFCQTCGSPLQAQDGQTQRVASQPGETQSFNSQAYQSGQSGYSQPYQQNAYETPYQQTAQMPPTSTPQGQYPPQKQGSNAPFVLAIIALVTAILGLFPVSLILAIIALALNSGQKKRGETSTKQTPTFVMGLISLILSIIMAIATVLLGGAIWLALVDDEIDLDHITASTAPSQTPSSSATAKDETAIGTWKAISMTLDDDEYDEEYLDMMEEMGMVVELKISSSGSAALEFLDEYETGTWTDQGSGIVEFDFDGETVKGVIDGDEITLSGDDDDVIVFRKTSSSSPTISTASVSSSSSSFASSSSASASISSASSSKNYSTTEEPSLADFLWYTDDLRYGNIVSGATVLTDASAISGGWKAYIFGQGMERFLNATISGSGTDVSATLVWHYVFNGSTGEGHDDTTPSFTLTGNFIGGTLDVQSQSGKLTVTDFWDDGSHQYAVGTYMWPDGAEDTVLLVRP